MTPAKRDINRQIKPIYLKLGKLQDLARQKSDLLTFFAAFTGDDVLATAVHTFAKPSKA